VFACLVAPNTAWSSGFVKGPGEHYTKLGLGVEARQTYGSGAEAFREDVRTVSLYSEAGLPLPWRSQLSAYVPWTSTVRKSVALGDEFQSASFADTRLGLKLDLGNKTFFADSSLPVSVYLASDLGYVVPTTPKDYREGNESERASDAPDGATFLVASSDRGISRWSQGLGLSVVVDRVWLSSRAGISQDARPKSPEATLALDLGTGLPWNSWIQVGYERIVAQAESTPAPSGDTDAKKPPPLKLETKLQGSLGVTVWDGLALELGYTQSRPQPSEKGPIIRTWSTGVSYRSL
jgi:hypothetical protein